MTSLAMPSVGFGSRNHSSKSVRRRSWKLSECRLLNGPLAGGSAEVPLGCPRRDGGVLTDPASGHLMSNMAMDHRLGVLGRVGLGEGLDCDHGLVSVLGLTDLRAQPAGPVADHVTGRGPEPPVGSPQPNWLELTEQSGHRDVVARNS